MSGARFELICTSDRTVLIRDRGPWGRHPTVTNDAESVVQSLYNQGVLKIGDGKRLFYFDSAGELDEIHHENGKFKGFGPFARASTPEEHRLELLNTLTFSIGYLVKLAEQPFIPELQRRAITDVVKSLQNELLVVRDGGTTAPIEKPSEQLKGYDGG